MDPLLLLPLAALSIGVAVLAWRRYASEPARTARWLRALPRSDVRTAAVGPVKIAGNVRLTDKWLVAPLSGRRCVLYDVVVTESQGQQGSRTIVQERVATDFSIEDATGTALVRTERTAPGPPGSQLELAIVQDARYKSGLFAEATPEHRRYLERWGEKTKGILFNRTLTFREGVFEPGEQVVVCGLGRREPDPDASAAGDGYRERPTRLVVEPLDGKLYVSDEPGLVEGPVPEPALRR